MSVFTRSLIGLPCSKRNPLDKGNCATTLEPSRIKKMALSCVLPRHCITSSLHVASRPSHAEFNALKNSSGSTSYFIEKKARYSPGDTLFLKVFLLFLPGCFHCRNDSWTVLKVLQKA